MKNYLMAGIGGTLAGTVTINAMWNYGPYDPSPVSAGTQPESMCSCATLR